MKKYLLAGLVLLGLAGGAQAQTQVYQTARGSATIVNVSISTASGAVQLDSKTANRWREGRFTVEIWNDDADDDLFVGFHVGISSTSSEASYGRRVAPRTAITWAVPDSVPIYARVTGSGSETAIAVFTQFK